MADGTTTALNKHLDRQEKQEVSMDCFIDSIDDELVEIKNMIEELQVRARAYDGYDFETELNDIIKDLV